MANLQLLLNSGLILIIATVLSTSEKLYNPPRYTYEFKSRLLTEFSHLNHYDIELTLTNFENTTVNYFNFSGTCKFFVHFTRSMFFQLHVGTTTKILSSSVVNLDQPETKFLYSISSRITPLAKLYTFNFFPYQLYGNYIVTFKFNGTAYDNELGLFRTSYMEDGNKRWLLATNFRPLGAHRVFPCKDEPPYRATFKISINCNQKYQVISNVALNYEQVNISSVTHILHKAVTNTTPKIYPNLVGFVVYDFLYKNIIKQVQEQTHRIHFRDLRLHINFAKKVIEDIATFFNDDWRKLEEFVEVKTVNYVLIPGFPFDSKDNWGLVYFREASVIYNEELDSFSRKIEVARLIAQTMAHQMFGNLVSPPTWWTDEWLNNGIAMLFGIDAVNKTFPDTRMWDLFVVRDLHESLHLDPYIRMKPLNNLHFYNTIDLEAYYGFHRYLKAPALLRMLRHIMTDEVYRNGIHLYLKTHKFQSATVDDFWTAMQIALDHNLKTKSLFDLKTAMNTWLNDNYPIVNVITNVNGNLDVNISHTNIKSFLAPEFWIPESEKFVKWWIPVNWISNNSLNQSYFSKLINKFEWLDPNETRVIRTININGWIIVNANRIGYYRVNYDVQNWQRIAQFLNSSSYTKLPVLTRAQLIDDAFHLMVDQKLESSVFWNLTDYFMQETDYIAWYPMIKALEYMSCIFPLSDDRVNIIKKHMVKILGALLNTIGYDAKSNEDNLTKCLIEEATKWACILGDPLCKKYVNEKLHWHLENRKEHKLLPWWKEWTYCKGLMEADSIIWHSMFNVWNSEHDHTVLKHLTCSEDYYVTVQFITLLSENNVINIQSNESAHSFLFLLSRHADKHLLEDIFDEFLDIKPNEVTEIAALSIIINHIYSKEQFEKVETFVSNKSSDLKSKVYHKIQTRSAEIENRIKYLEIVSK